MALPVLDRLARLRSVITDRRLAAALALGVGLWAVPASAHIHLMTPAARYSMDMLKAEPCGAPGDPPGTGPVATYQAGETITVEFDEFVDHAGHFRIALDPTGTDAFTSPTAFDDFYNSPEVLLDDIADMAGGVYSVDVTLPDTPCDPCTLQLIQVMNDGTFGPGTSDLYFQCSDIVIEGAGAGSGGDTGTAGGTAGEDTGGTAGEGSTGGGGDVGSGEPVDTAGDSTGSNGTAGTTEGGSGSTGSGGSDEGEKGCSCRANAGSPAAAAPLVLVVLATRRRRRARSAHRRPHTSRE
jgi:MYXO-CTERM domain-containing protein